jgi:hypothetical protein
MHVHACRCTRTAHRAGDIISVETAALVPENRLCTEACEPAPAP